MKKTLKVLCAVALACIMAVSIMVPAFAATVTPVVVINGIANNPIINYPDTMYAEKIWPPTDAVVDQFRKGMYSYIPGIAEHVGGVVAMGSGNYDEVMNFIVGTQLYSKFDFIKLNADGTSRSESLGVNTYEMPMSYYSLDEEWTQTIAGNLGQSVAKHIGEKNVYIFTYDWRVDPLETAGKLDAFIQTVKKNAKASKVDIIAQGFGATIATAYLLDYMDYAEQDVDSFVTVNSAFEGTSLIGDVYTGRIIGKLENVANQTFPSAYIRYTNDYSDNPVTWFAQWLTNYVLNRNWEIQSLCYDITAMMGNIKTNLYDHYLRELLQTFTGLWALVPIEYYEDALEFMEMYNEDGDPINEDLLKRIDDFKQLQTEDGQLLNDALARGIDISIVSSWDIQLYPIGDNSIGKLYDENFGISAQSDGLIDTHFSSFGATCIPLNDVGAAIENTQINENANCTNHNHLSAMYDYLDPDHRWGGEAHYIDASTCALPENTWFIHNMKFDTFRPESNASNFLAWLLTAEKPTVWANGQYIQFLNYNRYVKPGYLVFPSDPVDGKYMLGDVDLDGKVLARDARLALRISARLEDMPKEGSTVWKNTDVNGDGRITAADARIILRVSAGLESFDSFRNTSDAN